MRGLRIEDGGVWWGDKNAEQDYQLSTYRVQDAMLAEMTLDIWSIKGYTRWVQHCGSQRADIFLRKHATALLHRPEARKKSLAEPFLEGDGHAFSALPPTRSKPFSLDWPSHLL